MPENYAVKKISPFSIHRLMQVESILFKCGKNMAEKENLHHWDNSHIKNAIIVCLCVLKNILNNTVGAILGVTLRSILQKILSRG